MLPFTVAQNENKISENRCIKNIKNVHNNNLKTINKKIETGTRKLKEIKYLWVGIITINSIKTHLPIQNNPNTNLPLYYSKIGRTPYS